MPSSILLTGSSGFIGGHVLKVLLERGHTVKVSIRDESKASHILKQNEQAHKTGKLSYTVISDMYKADNFIPALVGIETIVHVASPFPQYDGRIKDLEKEIIDPAITMTKAVLEAASKSSINRVVITSSFAAINNNAAGGAFRDYTYSEKDWNPITLEQAKGHQKMIYPLSKVLAEKSAWNYMEETKPAFDLVVLNPPMVYGPLVHDFSIKNLNTSSQMLWDLVDAKDVPDTRLPFFIDVRDLALAHALAVETKEAGGNRFIIATPEPYSFQLLADELRKMYPDQTSRVPIGMPGKPLPEPVAKLDSSKAAKILGLKYRSFKDSVVEDTFGQLFAFDEAQK